MKTILVSGLVFLAMASASLQAETAADINQKIEKKRVKALTRYLQSHVHADDRLVALKGLVEARARLGDDEALIEALEEKYEAMDKATYSDLQDLMSDTVQPLAEAYRRTGQDEKALAFLSRVQEDTRSHPRSDGIEYFLKGLTKQLNRPDIGDVLEISFTDLNGGKVNIADMKGQVVLVDVWATWCGPCVGEAGNLKKAYQEYHPKGLEIVGISLDKDKKALVDFIDREKIPWPQQFDGKGWQNEFAIKLGVQSIPATFLLGKDGKVLAVDLTGQDLADKLAELLD